MWTWGLGEEVLYTAEILGTSLCTIDATLGGFGSSSKCKGLAAAGMMNVFFRRIHSLIRNLL